MAKSFETACCERFQCPSKDFPTAVLWHCFHPRGLKIGRVLHRISPAYFESELELIRWLAKCTEFQELKNELEGYRWLHPDFGLLRGWLKVRISGLRLLALGRELLP
jgi:hypothetical protein